MTDLNFKFFFPSLLGGVALVSGLGLAGESQWTNASVQQEHSPTIINQTAEEISYLPEIPDRFIESETHIDSQTFNAEQAVLQSGPSETIGQSSTVDMQLSLNTTSPLDPGDHASETESRDVFKSFPVSLVIKLPGKQLAVEIRSEHGDTVYQVLKTASKQFDFSLRVSQHASLGVFVEEIAGVKNNTHQGRYWLYYLNGAFATKGAGSQTVQPNDHIEWRYE